VRVVPSREPSSTVSSWRRRLPQTAAGWGGLAAVVWGVFVTAVAVGHQLTDDAIGPPNRPVAVDHAGYVSSDSCRSCHPGNYDSWHQSYHRRMTQVASADTVATEIDGFEGEYEGIMHRIVKQEDRYFALQRPAADAGAGWSTPREIVLLTGSHNLQMFWLETAHGRTMERFPFAYIIADDQWAPALDTFLLPPDFAEPTSVGEWNQACMDCHTTFARPRFVEGWEFDSRVAEFGISCESCHSNGAEHIAANRNPLRRYALHLGETPDDTMVNPSELDGPRSTLACGQCHSVWGFRDMESKLAWNQEGGQFRSGDDSMPYRWMVEPTLSQNEAARANLSTTNPHFFENRFWGDGMVRVTGREMNGIVMSPCYEGGNFSCISCHEMHPESRDPKVLTAWRNDQLRTDHGGTNQDCLQCHGEIARDISAHTFHAPESAGSSCYDCHMPHSSYGLLRAVRSHQVSSPNVLESVEHGRPNACNLCHLDQPLGWTAAKLDEWYGQPVPELDADDRTIAAAVLWLLEGDAGQRAVVTWNMSRPEAQAAAGHDWMYPLLAINLNDPYSAVRYITAKTLRGLPGFADFAYVYTTPEQETRPAVTRAYEHWFNAVRSPDTIFTPRTIQQPNGLFIATEQARLMNNRDQRPIFLAE